MKKITITFDLDNTIFDIGWIYERAWGESHFITTSSGMTYNYEYFNLSSPNFEFPKLWDYHKDDNWKGDPAEQLDKLFVEQDVLTQSNIPESTKNILNNIIHNPLFEVYFITDRPLYMDTYGQMIRNGIDIDRDHVITTKMKLKIISFVNSQLHFDDAPHVLEKLDIPRVAISNEHTVYNHNYVKEHPLSTLTYKNIDEALNDLNNILTHYNLMKE